MSLIKWTPRHSLLTPFTSDSWASEIDRFLDSFFPGRLLSDWHRNLDGNLIHPVDWIPAFDVMEKDKEYVVRVEAPGMKKSDFSVTIKDSVLTITGEKKGEEEKNDDRYSYRESRYGRFSRSFRLPDEVVEKKIKADYKNGVLTIRVPRTKPVEVKETKVEII